MSSSDSWVNEAKKCPANKVAPKVGQKRRQKKKKNDKRWSMKKKKSMKEKKYFKQHDKILETNIPYGFNATKSPHVVLHKWYHRFKDNCILLKLQLGRLKK